MGVPPLSEKQREEAREALREHKGNQTAAAAALGIARSTFQNRLGNYHITNADGEKFLIKAKSELFDGDGNLKLQWIKSAVDRNKLEELVRETIKGLLEGIKPAKPIKSPAKQDKDLMNAICIGDAHIGLYCWGDETGEDFDSEIAQQELCAAVDRVLGSMPPADTCFVAQLGDFFHIDDQTNATPAHGNRLDVDTRFPKVIRTGIATMRYAIDRALQTHRKVIVRNVAGNHDPHASVTLTEALRGYYHNEPRVDIVDTPRPFYVIRFGKNLIGMTHGHQGKPERYPGILAVDGAEWWGECEHKTVWHGHFHQKKAFEDMGVLVESFRTLAGPDAWAISQGYRPGRELQGIVLHREFGEIERHTAGIRRVRDGKG